MENKFKNVMNTCATCLKKIQISSLIFSVLFSFMMICSRHINIPADMEASNFENTTFTDVHLIDLMFFIGIAVLVYMVVSNIRLLKKETFFDTEARGKWSVPQLIICAVVMLLCWTPYVFSNWPGGVYNDTMNSIWIAMGTDPFTSHEPVLYTLLWKLMFGVFGGSLEPGDYGAMYAFTIIQPIMFIATFTAFLGWCYKNGMKRWVITALTLVFALFPLYPFYGISLWKDSVFGIIVFLYSWNLYVLGQEIKNNNDISVRNLVFYILTSVGVVFGRNNGIYIVILVSIILVLIYLKTKALLKKLGISSVAVIVLSLIIQHPVFDALDYNVDTVVESLAVPLQQTAFIVSTGGTYSDKDAEVINNIMPLENWSQVYEPMISDYLKFDGSFDRNYLSENTGKYLATYLHLCLENPVKAVKSYMITTLGYWDIFRANSSAYISPSCVAWTGIFQGDYFGYYTGVSFNDLVMPRKYISAAIFDWFMVLVLCISLSKKKKERIPAILPGVGVFITIMLAAPLAFSFRYIFALVMCVPLYFICLIDE